MQNVVSDQASTNKKLFALLQDWRLEQIPAAVENWETLSEDEKQRYTDFNVFWCGLHFIVGLSDISNKVLQVWESLVHQGQKAGAPGIPGGYSKPGESGTVRCIRTVCKAVQDRGCERAGKPVEFRDFLHNQDINKVPLVPFMGSRFNVVFHNGAGVFFLYKCLTQFVGEHKGDNRLFSAIHADLSVVAYVAGCRALGLISKQVTAPLWRFLEADGHVQDLTATYPELTAKFKVT